MAELIRIERTLRQLADSLACYRKERNLEGEPAAIDSEPTDAVRAFLMEATPEDERGMVDLAIRGLGQITGTQGVHVLIAGVHRTSGGTTSWYELFSEKKIEQLLHVQAGFARALETLTSVERLRLLLVLVSGVSRSVEAMEASKLSQGQFYHHLRALEGSGMARKKAHDQYEATLHGISSLFTMLAVASLIMAEMPFVEEESS